MARGTSDEPPRTEWKKRTFGRSKVPGIPGVTKRRSVNHCPVSGHTGGATSTDKFKKLLIIRAHRLGIPGNASWQIGQSIPTLTHSSGRRGERNRLQDVANVVRPRAVLGNLGGGWIDGSQVATLTCGKNDEPNIVGAVDTSPSAAPRRFQRHLASAVMRASEIGRASCREELRTRRTGGHTR